MEGLPSGLRFALTGSWRRPVRLKDAEQRFERAIAGLRRLPYREYLQTAHWQRTRALALIRAGHACSLCANPDDLQVHHRSYARKGFEQPEDLIVLCGECHATHHRALALAAIDARSRLPMKVSLLSGNQWIAKGA